MNIYLIGYMGSGKSTLGHELAVALATPSIDLDEEFEKRYKIKISQFFEKYGENAFRELEHKILTDISLMKDVVVSTGGGTPCFHDNMELMKSTGLTIYLKGTPALLLSRIESSGSKRPIFQKMKGEKSLHNISEHLKTREFYYQKSHLTIDASKPDITELKELIRSYSGA
jgi:shikimate kinase